ncbi:MAG: SPFH domain-containing protein [Ignavibacteria bacterium]|jgi:uncharacterized membrane protein YqiK
MSLLVIGGIVVATIVGIAFLAWAIGLVVINEDKVGIVSKNFGKSLQNGRIIALDGEAGIQVDTLSPGWHFFYWPWQYSIEKVDLVAVPKGEIALVIANDGKELPKGRRFGDSVACNSYQDARGFINNGGSKGQQLEVLTTGIYRINVALFTVITSQNCKNFGLEPRQLMVVELPANKIGIVTTFDGVELQEGEVAAPNVEGHSSFQNPQEFIRRGGCRGLQQEVLRSGAWIINPWFASVKTEDVITVPMAHVGVVFSAVGPRGKDVSGDGFKNGELVEEGCRGVWNVIKNPGMYPYNPAVIKVENVQTSSIVLNWSNNKHEDHGLDNNLGTITVQSKDGFTFPLEVQQVIHIPYGEAPKIIAQFGNVKQLVSQVLEPMIGNYFRNAVQSIDAKEFFNSRKERQQAAQEYISKELSKYNVVGVGTFIGEMKPPAELMKTLQDRKMAEEGAITVEQQMKMEEKRQAKERQTALADSQREVVQSEQAVKIASQRASASIAEAEGNKKVVTLRAEADAETRKITADAEGQALKLRSTNEADSIRLIAEANAAKITLEGEAQAEVTRKQTDAMGQGNYAAIQVADKLAKGNLKLVPDIMLGGGAGGTSAAESLIALLAVQQATGKSITEVVKPSEEVKPVQKSGKSA